MIVLLTGCDNAANFPIAPPDAKATDARIIGRWQFEEDTNSHNFYEVYIAHKDYPHQYHIRFWNRGGTNPTYESNMHFSDINGVRFINVPYFEEVGAKQYGFLKILSANEDMSKFTAAVVGDTTMYKITSADILRKRIISNMNNPKFYSDTVHFYKMQ